MSEEDQKQHLLSNKDKDEIVNIPTEKGPPLKWMTVFIFTLTSMISWGLIAAFPVYFVRCIEYFDKGRAETAIISAIMTGVYYTLSIVPGKSGCGSIFNFTDDFFKILQIKWIKELSLPINLQYPNV